ncbi:hypothetical protein EV363DRAFT_1295584 [Boletus edulis]|nr:hypothetical protein EV363DRAFT_1295584 [Boletus edulis]
MCLRLGKHLKQDIKTSLFDMYLAMEFIIEFHDSTHIDTWHICLENIDLDLEGMDPIQLDWEVYDNIGILSGLMYEHNIDNLTKSQAEYLKVADTLSQWYDMPFKKLTAKQKKTTFENGTCLIDQHSGWTWGYIPFIASIQFQIQSNMIPPIQLVDRHIHSECNPLKCWGICILHIEWQIPQETINDSLAINPEIIINTDVVGTCTHVLPRMGSVLLPLTQWTSPTALLDTCINGCAALLCSEFNPRPGDFLVISSKYIAMLSRGRHHS